MPNSSTAKANAKKPSLKVYLADVIARRYQILPDRLRQKAEDLHTVAKNRRLELFVKQALCEFGKTTNQYLQLFVTRLADEISKGTFNDPEIQKTYLRSLNERHDIADAQARNIGNALRAGLQPDKLIAFIRRATARSPSGCPNETAMQAIKDLREGYYNDLINPGTASRIAKGLELGGINTGCTEQVALNLSNLPSLTSLAEVPVPIQEGILVLPLRENSVFQKAAETGTSPSITANIGYLIQPSQPDREQNIEPQQVRREIIETPAFDLSGIKRSSLALVDRLGFDQTFSPYLPPENDNTLHKPQASNTRLHRFQNFESIRTTSRSGSARSYQQSEERPNMTIIKPENKKRRNDKQVLPVISTPTNLSTNDITRASKSEIRTDIPKPESKSKKINPNRRREDNKAPEIVCTLSETNRSKTLDTHSQSQSKIIRDKRLVKKRSKKTNPKARRMQKLAQRKSQLKTSKIQSTTPQIEKIQGKNRRKGSKKHQSRKYKDKKYEKLRNHKSRQHNKNQKKSTSISISILSTSKVSRSKLTNRKKHKRKHRRRKPEFKRTKGRRRRRAKRNIKGIIYAKQPPSKDF